MSVQVSQLVETLDKLHATGAQAGLAQARLAEVYPEAGYGRTTNLTPTPSTLTASQQQRGATGRLPSCSGWERRGSAPQAIGRRFPAASGEEPLWPIVAEGGTSGLSLVSSTFKTQGAAMQDVLSTLGSVSEFIAGQDRARQAAEQEAHASESKLEAAIARKAVTALKTGSSGAKHQRDLQRPASSGTYGAAAEVPVSASLAGLVDTADADGGRVLARARATDERVADAGAGMPLPLQLAVLSGAADPTGRLRGASCGPSSTTLWRPMDSPTSSRAGTCGSSRRLPEAEVGGGSSLGSEASSAGHACGPMASSVQATTATAASPPHHSSSGSMPSRRTVEGSKLAQPRGANQQGSSGPKSNRHSCFTLDKLGRIAHNGTAGSTQSSSRAHDTAGASTSAKAVSHRGKPTSISHRGAA